MPLRQDSRCLYLRLRRGALNVRSERPAQVHDRCRLTLLLWGISLPNEISVAINLRCHDLDYVTISAADVTGCLGVACVQER